jgi:hypothetical protein
MVPSRPPVGIPNLQGTLRGIESAAHRIVGEGVGGCEALVEGARKVRSGLVEERGAEADGSVAHVKELDSQAVRVAPHEQLIPALRSILIYIKPASSYYYI